MTPSSVGAPAKAPSIPRAARSTTSFLKAALSYAAAGFRVFPLVERGKKPRIAGGHSKATADQQQIREWWSRYPTANIGLLAGEGLAVVDVDPRNGGLDSLAELTKRHGQLETKTARTGGGGFHYYFRDDEAAPLRSGNGLLGPGLDIKSGGKGYVVAPPSIHASGEPYEWVAKDTKIRAVPEWLRESVGAITEAAAPLAETRSRVLLAPGDELSRLRWTRHVLDAIPNDDRYTDRSRWVGIAHAIHSSCGPELSSEACELFADFSQRWTEGAYDADETLRVWETLGKSNQPGGYKTLLATAGSEYKFPRDHPWRAENAFSLLPSVDGTVASSSLLMVQSGRDPNYLAALNRVGAITAGPPFLDTLDAAEAAIAAIDGRRERAHAEAMLQQQLEKRLGRRGAHAVRLASSDAGSTGPVFQLLESLMSDPELLRPPEATIPYLAYKGRATLLAGPDKSGKSTLAAHAVAAKTRGKAFLGQATTAAPVLIVAPDESLGDTVRRLAELGADPSNVQVFTRPSPAVLDEVRRVAAEWRPEFIVIDSLQAVARLILGEAPQSGDASAWSEVVRPLVDIAHEYNIATLILHHVRKSDGEARDSTEILAAVDGTLTLRLPRSSEDPHIRRISGRARWQVPPFTVALRGEGEDARYELVSGARKLSLDERVLSHVQDNPGCSRTAVRDAVEGRAHDIGKAIDRLIHSDNLENRGTGQGAALYVNGRYTHAASAFDEVAPEGEEDLQ